MEGLGDSSQLLQWLENCCQEVNAGSSFQALQCPARSCHMLQLESQQGGTDEAARAQIDVLRQQISALAQVTEQQRQAQLGRSSQSGQAQDELQLAQNLDRCPVCMAPFLACMRSVSTTSESFLALCVPAAALTPNCAILRPKYHRLMRTHRSCYRRAPACGLQSKPYSRRILLEQYYMKHCKVLRS